MPAPSSTSGFARAATLTCPPNLSAFIESAVAEEEVFEVTPEIAAALEEGERSGYVPYDFEKIMAEAKRQFRAE